MWNKKFCLQKLNQVCLHKTLIKRGIFDDYDEIEIRISLLNYLNILEYIWWLLNSEFKFCFFCVTSEAFLATLEVPYNQPFFTVID